MSRFFSRYQKPIIWAVVIAFLVGGAGLLSLNQAGVLRPSPGDDPGRQYIAVVNGEGIPTAAAEEAATTLLNYYRNVYEQANMSFSDLVSGASGALFLLDLRSQGLNVAIRKVLYSQQASHRGIRVSSADVNAAYADQYQELLQTHGLTEPDLERILAQQGQTLAGFQASIRQDVADTLRDARLREAIVGSIRPTEDDLMAYIEANVSRYHQPERIRASHILVSEESQAAELLLQLEAGADFAALAEEHSDCPSASSGGDLEWFSRGDMVPEFEDVAFSLDTGQISEPVLTQFGYHIIKLTDREESHMPRLSEIRSDVEADYIQEREDEVFGAWYQAVLNGAEIVIHDPLLHAYRLRQRDLALGIAEYERLLETREVADPYFEYYIGRAYEQWAAELAAERIALESVEEPSDEDLARIEELRAQSRAREAKALEHYLNALTDGAVEADEDFVNRALRLDPSSTDARFILGELYAGRGDHAGAEEQFARIIEESPEYVRAFIASGDLALRQGDAEHAVARFEAAAALRPGDSTLLTKLAAAYLATGSWDRAEDTLTAVEQIDPGNVRVHLSRGELAHALLEQAVAERDALLSLDEDQRSAEEDARLRLLNEEVSQQADEAISRYRRALQSGATLDLMVKLGQVYVLVDRLNEAEAEFRRVISRSPYRVEAYVGMADVMLRRGDVDAALQHLRSAHARSLDDAERLMIAQRIVSLDATDALMRLRLAHALAQQRNWSAAMREYSAVLDANPDLIEAYRGIAEAYRGRSEFAAAIEYLQRGLQRAQLPSEKTDLYIDLIRTVQLDVGIGQPLPSVGQNARFELAKLYLDLGRRSEALELLDAMRTENPSYRVDEVNALVLRAGGAIHLPAEADQEETPEPPAEDEAPRVSDDE